MLPPVEDAVLANNPEFASLYAKLTTSALNADGSSKDDPAAKERGAVTEELNRYRLKAAKQSLLLDAIANANPQSLQAKPAPAPTLTKRPRAPQQPTSTIAELPAPLLDLLLLLPPLLTASSELSPESTALLLSNPPLSDFPDHLPSSPPLSDRKADLTRARLAAAASLSSLLASQTAVLAQLLRALEAKHGAVARSLELRAAEAALAAQRQQAEAEAALWLARRDAYPPAAQRALANYARHLCDAKARLNEAIHALRAELEAYGVDSVAAAAATAGEGGRRGEAGGAGKEKVMREMARVYRDMSRQLEEVRSDLERLGRA
ncbi:d99df3d7-f7b6-47e4-8ef1-b3f63379b7f1 [Thermothielavioides terrestris]|uniref:D99df3d7-f7b6-47e4-8ef1-b3f63379b7f1 n=1 Tax=Thermothielavioides terrestris TaxID=2587410 RepID=A0A3S4DAE2_9PEZI|nr:d99df3d7-f7b6-47e4-8ef1-b3f63379b7f1 [Thermothielavioides terrestris]